MLKFHLTFLHKKTGNQLRPPAKNNYIKKQRMKIFL
jgi:hypothetical protein